MKADLHCHSNCSDGELSPLELIERARHLGLQHFAITDHDTVAAYAQLEHIETGDLNLHTGIEFSSMWSGRDIHIVGLDIDIEHPALLNAVEAQNQRREKRAQAIANKLEKAGVKNALDCAIEVAGKAQLGRPHFAQVLIAQGKVKNHKQAFDRYLAMGKSCYVASEWPSIEEICRVILTAGGVPILAHPTKYKMTATKLRALVKDFTNAGGKALEFSSGQSNKDSQAFLKSLCLEHKLKASPASDFHSDHQSWAKLGRVGELPADIACVV